MTYDTCLSYAIVDAPNCGGRVPVDTTPGPVPVYRALKSQPLSSELHLTNFSAGATVEHTVLSTMAPVELAPR